MSTIAAPTTQRKAFYALMDDTHGILTQDDAGAVWFRDSATQALTLITPEMSPFMMPLGEVGVCDTQRLRDGDRVRKCSQTLVGV